jgi:hypothetical protein
MVSSFNIAPSGTPSDRRELATPLYRLLTPIPKLVLGPGGPWRFSTQVPNLPISEDTFLGGKKILLANKYLLAPSWP